MKRLICLLLLICLTVSSALAVDRAPLRLGDNIPMSSYWEENGIPTTECYFAAFADGQDKLAQLQSDNAPDLFGLITSNEDFESFKAAGVLADLSGSEIIQNAVSRMRPETQRLLTTEDGRIIGLPNAHMLRPLYWDQEAWDAAGLTSADVPQSFTELLDFLEAWAVRVEASPEKNVCVIAFPDDSAVKEADRDASWLVGLLLTTWEMQQRYAGEAVTFNTPNFIALAERAREVGRKLYQVEPRLKKRAKLLQLFCDETLNPGAYAFDGRDYGLSHTVPLRITNGQPALLRADAVIQCVHAGSAWLDEAVAFLEGGMNQAHWALRYSLYTDFAPGQYDGGAVSAGWMADLAAYDGTLVYLVSGYDAQKEQYELPFAKGEITAQQLAEGLDAPVAQ